MSPSRQTVACLLLGSVVACGAPEAPPAEPLATDVEVPAVPTGQVPGIDRFAAARHSFDPPKSPINDEELAAARRFVEAESDNPEAHRKLAQLLRRGNWRKEAIRYFERAAELSPHPRYELDLALAYTSLARFAEAEELYRGLLDRPRYKAIALHNMGNLETRRDRIDQAIVYYRQAIEARPDYLLAQCHLGLALLQAGQRKEAATVLTGVLQLPLPSETPQRIAYFDAAYRLATLEQELGNHEQAVRVLSTLLQQVPDHPNALYAYGRSLLALGREEEARQAFERQVRLPERMMGRTAWIGSPPVETEIEQPVTFRDVADPSGIRYRNVCGQPAGNKDWITEGIGAGAAWLDYDGDGVLDLYLVNGSTHDRAAGRGEPNQLYRGDGAGGFIDVTTAAGVGDRGWGYGVAVADVDNDGDPDLYVTNYGPNVLYLNNGDGSFTDVTARAGVGDDRWGVSAAFFDLEPDGDLDLYVGNYLEMDPAVVPRVGESEYCLFKGLDVICGPKPLVAQQDVLYRNDGDGRFTDITEQGGVALSEPRYTLGVVTGDFDNDGLTDLYVANDSMVNSLWRNRGDGTLGDAGVVSLSAVNAEGRAQAGMGTAFGDYDGDGWLDLVVTNFSHDLNTIYRNIEGKYFSDETTAVGLGVTGPALSWGTGFYDFNNDTHLDLFIANGHLHPEMDQLDMGTTYRQANHLFLNDGENRFVEFSREAGPGMALLRSFRGAAFADYDNDGDVDVLVTAIDEEVVLLNNQTANPGHWLGVRLIGTKSNRDAIGARVTATLAGRRLIRERAGGGSFLSESDPRVHFGLGAATVVDRLEVRWPGGGVDVLENVAVDRLITVTEGREATP